MGNVVGLRIYAVWGDCHCCPDCYEGFNPPFNSEENERETTEAYEAMLNKYIGKKSETIRDDSVDLELECTDCGLVNYKMTVNIDEDGIINVNHKGDCGDHVERVGKVVILGGLYYSE